VLGDLPEHAHQNIIQKLLYNRWPLYLSAVKGCKLLVQFILNEKRNHQDMLMDKPESVLFKRKSTTSLLPYLQALNNGVGRLVSEWSIL
jgi:hypothetical protein